MSHFDVPVNPRIVLDTAPQQYSKSDNDLLRRQLEVIFRSFLGRFQVLEQDPGPVAVYTVAELPTSTACHIAFASDGRKTGEGAGTGTGVLVYHDGIAWRRVDDGTTVVA